MERYECMMEPTETWMIWDHFRDLPAETPNIVLVGLSRDDAMAICRLMNVRLAA